MMVSKLLRGSALVVAGLLVAGCSSEEDETAPVEVCDELGLCLTQPTQGFQLRSDGYEIQAGEDVEYCEVLQLPGGPDDIYYVERFEVAMTLYSHHLIVSAIEPGSPADENATVGDRVPCTGGDVFGGNTIPVTGSQQPYNETVYPQGVGRRYTGGMKLVFDYHYYNTTPDPIRARAAVNFHTTDEANIQRIVQTFGMVNIGFNIPPMATGSVNTECTLHQEMDVFSLTRHTHRWGTNFSVWFHGGDRDGEHIFTSKNFEQDVEHIFNAPVRVKPGEGFAFECNFNNTETYPLTFGQKATDEMCILFGDWYVPMDMDHTPFQDGCIVATAE